MRAVRFAMVVAAVLGGAVATQAGLAPTKSSQLVSAYTFGACPIPGHTGANSTLLSQSVGGDGGVTPFAIPAKKAFVLTDLVATTGAALPGNGVMVTSILVGSASKGTQVAARFDPSSALGTVAASFTFPAGIPIKSGSSLCVEMLDLTHGGFVGFSAFAHGYFVADK